jgi:hypothetical protein
MLPLDIWTRLSLFVANTHFAITMWTPIYSVRLSPRRVGPEVRFRRTIMLASPDRRPSTVADYQALGEAGACS